MLAIDVHENMKLGHITSELSEVLKFVNMNFLTKTYRIVVLYFTGLQVINNFEAQR